jgi:hypothetical protein
MVRTIERDASKCQANDHAWCAPNHDFSPSDFVDPFQRYKGEDEVGTRDNKPDCCGLIEADFFKEGRGIIHEGIETTQLLKRLHPTSDD